MARRKRRGLGSPDGHHASQGAKLTADAWRDLERMPPTCEGGIQLASRALANANRAQAHLQSIGGRTERERFSDVFGDANRAAHAANKTLNFFARTCKVSGRKAADRPLFSRHKK